MLGGDDGKLKFKIVSWRTDTACREQEIIDMMPDIGQEATFVTDIMPPALLTPVFTVVPQNNPAIGCAWNPLHGFGFQVLFDWTDSPSRNGIKDYQFQVWNPNVNGGAPIIDTNVPISLVRFTFCNTFVSDSDLGGWEWRVRARDAVGAFSNWSDTGRFRFIPCRINDAVCTGAP